MRLFVSLRNPISALRTSRLAHQLTGLPVPAFRRDGRPTTGDPMTTATQTAVKRPPRKTETVMVNVRVRRAVIEAINQAIQASPIEFGCVSDFHRKAIEHELQRRGLLETFD